MVFVIVLTASSNTTWPIQHKQPHYPAEIPVVYLTSDFPCGDDSHNKMSFSLQEIFFFFTLEVSQKKSWLTSLDGMLTTPVDLLFSLSFLFSICPFPFLALGPLLFFSFALLGDGLSLSLSLHAMGLEESGEAHGAFSGWGGVFFRLEVGEAGWWCVSSSGLFKAEPEEDRATE